MSSRKILVLIFALSLASGVRAVNLGLAREDAGQAGALLEFGASARSLGMGHAHTAVAEDASAGYWNPSGLSQIDRKNFVAMYSSLELATDFGYFGFALPTVDYGTFGMGLLSLRSTGF